MKHQLFLAMRHKCLACLLVFSSGSLPAFAIDGLLGYWRFEEGAGNLAVDSSGQGHDGEIIASETAWVVDPDRGTVYASGNGSYVDFGTILPVIDLDQDFTWSFWVNPNETDNNNIVFGNRWAPDGADFAPREFIKFTPRVFEWHVDGLGQNVPGANTMFVVGEWSHNLVVKSGTTLTYYRNGEEVASRPITSAPVNAQPLYLGGQNSSENFSGLFDEVAVFDRALLADEVLEVYLLGDANGSLSGAGDDPNILTAARTDLGQIAAVPAEHSGSFVVRNTGASEDLMVTEIIVTGDDADHFTIMTTLPVTIAAGESAEMAYQFQSNNQSGGFAAQFDISSNDASNPVHSIEVRAAILNLQGPLAHYRLNEEAGAGVMRDASGFGRDGLFAEGPGTLTLGVEGLADERAMAVSGNAHAEVAAGAFDVFESFTVTMWIAGDTMNEALQTLIGRGFDSPSFAILVSAGNLLWLQGSEAEPLLASEGGLIQSDQVYHVAVLAAADAPRIAFYLDGAELASLTAFERLPDENDTPLFIGAFNHALGFDGKIDDVQIYGRALSSEEIQSLFLNPGATLSETTDVDSDGDGLSDAEEVELGTDPLHRDSDRDGLEDGAEVNVHGTSPTLADTDGDGATDGLEVALGTDPTDASSAPEALSSDDLLGYWRFDEGNGQSATDSSGNAHNGVILNAGGAWRVDPDRGSVYRSGGGSYVDFGEILPVIGVEQDFSWSFWVNAGETANNDIVLGNRYMADGNDFDPREFIKFTPTVFEWHFNGLPENTPAENTAFTVGVWQHNLVVKDGQMLTYYRGGEVIAESTITGAPVNAQPFYLGGQPDNLGGVAENFDGLFDEVAIFARALSAEEVLMAYYFGLAGQALVPAAAPPATAPEIMEVSKTAEGLVLQFPEGATYEVEYSSDLRAWMSIATDVTGRFVDTDAERTSGLAGFYRGVVSGQ